MQPLKLTMTAFGPYKDKEIVDFRELGDQRLFVISGMTGAGKTTIFDGISFALYGSGSGQDRQDTKSLRSDFADDAIHTSVELVFEMHGRTYRVLRQLGHVKKGNKSATGEKYELYEMLPDGTEQPAVERMKVREVDKKIEEILGLTQDQFSQIVMLPQGEFRKLLTSETENKEEILRKIFKTDRYLEVIKKLDQKRRQAEQQLAQSDAIRKSQIAQIAGALPNRQSKLFEVIQQEGANMHQLLESLEEEAEYYNEQIKRQQHDYNLAFKQHGEMQEQYITAKNNNELLEKHEKRKMQLAQLELQRPKFEAQKIELEAAERASRIEPFEQQAEILRKELDVKQKALSNAMNALESAKLKYSQATQIFDEEKNKSEEREKVAARITNLSSLIPVFKELEEAKQAVNKLLADVEKARKSLELAVNKRDMSSNQLHQIANEIQQGEAKLIALDDSSAQLDFLRDQMKALKEMQKHTPVMQNLEQQMAMVRQQKQQVELQLKTEEQKWMSNQASILALQLVDGDPCPVCGSTTHIHPKTEQHDAPNEQQLEQLRQNLQQTEQQFLKIYGEYTSAKSNEERLLSLLHTLDTSLEQFEQVQKQYMEVGQFVQNLKQINEQIKERRADWQKEQQQLEILQQQLATVEQIFKQKSEQLVAQQTILKEKQKLISSEFDSLQQLEQRIYIEKQQKELLEGQWEQAQKQLQQASEAFSTSDLHVTHCQQMLQEVTEKLMAAKDVLNNHLSSVQFDSFEAYTAAKRPEAYRQQLNASFTQFIQEMHVLQSNIQEGAIKLAEIEWKDLADTEQQLILLKNQYEQAYRTLNQSIDSARICKDFYDKMLLAGEQIAQLEGEATAIIELYNVLRGQNERKISFERYVQIGYLEQITHAANRRLKYMSDGQYSLHCSERQESHGRQSGLSLDVFDEFTGQMRDVKTLSGGEKFNASLCLALGMADVIQSFQGNIRIDTMFIDEGFGSLDQETLVKAIDTLIDLQKSGRMIGVISHVEELKNAIPAILEVVKAREGHSKTRFVLK